jgi:hypothetical protein
MAVRGTIIAAAAMVLVVAAKGQNRHPNQLFTLESILLVDGSSFKDQG